MSAAVHAPAQGRDFPFTAADFRRVCEMIRAHAGISLGDSKQEMVYSRLARRVRACGLSSFQDYIAVLEHGEPREWEQFTNALTTNLTSFFREAHHFPLLVAHMRSRERGRPLRVWSCASSTGEEAYSMGIALAEASGNPATVQPDAQILATDLDTRVLAVAQAGVYDQERVEALPAAQLHRFFQRGNGAHAGKVRVRPELAAAVRFRQLNLLADDWLGLKKFDAIFCRNVLIYFDKPTQHTLLRKLARLLEPDGLLFAGHSESLLFAAETFRLRGKTVYELTEKSAR